MNAYQTILLFQGAFDGLTKLRRFANSWRQKSTDVESPMLEGIDHFSPETTKQKRALLSLVPDAWNVALRQYPNIRMFNYIGLTYELVKALNESGYMVDICHFTSEHVPSKDYDLFVGHGGYCKTIVDSLPEKTPIFHYLSGAHWDAFVRESNERYKYFSQRKKLKENLEFQRTFTEHVAGDQYLREKADAIFSINCPRLISQYKEHSNKFYLTGYGAYKDVNLYTEHNIRDFEGGRKNFIYVGGTSGNIQKGLDIVIDAFSRNPDLNLYIYCKIEADVMRSCRQELQKPNIHYIYHWRTKLFVHKLKNLMKSIVYTVHAPINIGMGTAYMGSLGLGLIPVGYVDYAGSEDSAILTDSWKVEDLSDCIREASVKSVSWCRKAESLVLKFYEENCTPEGFGKRFKELVALHTSNPAHPFQELWQYHE
jgi:hypothetical protein